MPILTQADNTTLEGIRTTLNLPDDAPQDGKAYLQINGAWEDRNISKASGLGKYTLLASDTDVVTAYNLTTIPSSWQSYSTIKGVVIGQGVTSIGSQAFYYCSGLTSLVIPNSVTSIGSFAFRFCSGLTSLVIPNSVTSIGYYAFQGCSSLTGSLVIPNSVTSFGDSAFSNCSGLTSLTIPNSVTSIGDYAFFNCSGLTSLTIPNSVTSIGTGAFGSCSGLTTIDCYVAKSVIDVSNSLQNTIVTTIHVRASDGTWDENDNPHTIGDQSGITVIKDL